jgi:hypothetical protein
MARARCATGLQGRTLRELRAGPTGLSRGGALHRLHRTRRKRDQGEDQMRMFSMSAALLAGSFCIPAAYAEALSVSHAANTDYQSVQEAIDALPAQGGDIRIAPGTYREKVKTSKSGIHIVGTGAKPEDTVIVYGDGAINAGGTARSATLDAAGDDFRLENLTIQNDYALNPANPPSQGVALSVTGDGTSLRASACSEPRTPCLPARDRTAECHDNTSRSATSRGMSMLYSATPRPGSGNVSCTASPIKRSSIPLRARQRRMRTVAMFLIIAG